MKKLIKNSEMNEMRLRLKPLLLYRNKIGYIAARNYRNLDNSLIEYDRFKDDLIRKYGEADIDNNGNELPSVSVKIGTAAFKKFCDELEPLNNIEHEVELMTAKYEDVIDCLSGEEILGVDWMLED